MDGAAYVCAYNGHTSRWYGSALSHHAGRITAGGVGKDVSFVPIDEASLNARIDDAYRAKSAGSPYLPPIVTDRVLASTMRVDPR